MGTALFRYFLPASFLLAFAIGCSSPETDQHGTSTAATEPAAATHDHSAHTPAAGAANPARPDTGTAAPATIVAQLDDEARRNPATLYAQLCARCHGLDGTPVLAGAPNLKTLTCPKRAISGTIYSGRGLMPAFGKVLTRAEISSLADYVQGMQEGAD